MLREKVLISIMSISAQFRSLLLQPEINRISSFYNQEISDTERLSLQLNQFNTIWQKLYNNVPYYKNLFQLGYLPEKFSSWNQFLELMPVSDKKLYISEKSKRTDNSKKPDYLRSTSGSSGNPLQIPAWNSEIRFTRPDQWVGRRWYGINPEDRCFWLTTNSYLLGTGFKGSIRKYKRAFIDKLLSYYIFPAYNISPDVIRKMSEVLIKQKPDYVIGFSAVLDLFARINYDRRKDIKQLNIKAIIATSEIFPFDDSPQVIEDVFQAPVAMEYGTNETIAIAHTLPSGNFKVFWKNYFIEGAKSNNSDLKDVRITSLYPRCFPLIRYDVGDQIELIDNEKSSEYGIEYFRKIHGRKNNYVLCESGERIHTSAFSSTLRIFPEITGYQIINNGTDITLNIVMLNTNLTPDISGKIKQRLSIIHPELSKLKINQVGQVEQTSNGKTPLLIRS